MLVESVKNLSKLFDMFFPWSAKNQDIIEIDNDAFTNKGRRSSSIYLMKVSGAFVKPKGMTNHSNSPSLVLKVVFHTSMDSIGI